MDECLSVLVLAVLLACFPAVFSNVVIYPAAHGINTNEKFNIVVIQNGNRHPSPVYMSSSQHRTTEASHVRGGRTMSWTSFAFSGASVTVEVHTLKAFQQCIVRPKSYGYNCTKTGVKTAHFNVTDTSKMMSVEFDYDYGSNSGGPDIKDKLMVFADPPETDVPSRHEAHVLYYPPGVHDLHGQLTLDYGIRQVYLAPGSWVYGGFNTSANHSVRIHGRGVLDNSPYRWHDPRFEWGTINMDKGSGHTLEGIVISDSVKFFIRALSSNNTVKNVKTVGAWIFNNDGIAIGEDARVEDSFFHANDDAIKLYKSGMQVHKCVVWQAQNGAVFQTGWWVNRTLHNVVVSDIDVIHTDWCTFQRGRNCRSSDNRAVFNNAGNTNRRHTIDIGNVVFRNIRVEGSCPRIIYWKMREGATGLATNVHFINWDVESQPANDSLHNAIAGTRNTGHVTNWQFNNFRIGGQCVEKPGHFDFQIDQQTTSGINFTCPGPVGK